MRNPRIVAAGLLLAANIVTVKAQDRCATPHPQPTEAQARALSQRRQAYQDWLAEGGPNKVTGGVRVIPTVVHIIQQTPQIMISDARVVSQIDVLNEDFRKLNADTSSIPAQFLPVAADCEIEFRLATIDPNGCPTTGINRVVAPQLAIHGIDDEQDLKSYVQWDPHKYLNIWVPVNLKDNLLGYATFPSWLPWNAANDGVVINGNNFGRGNGTPFSTYNLGRTATHEVGHWLGLYHTFEGNCSGMSPLDCASQGDEVCDTPPVNGPTYGCPSNLPNTCSESPTDLADQTMNYMDYTDDACMYMFSEGQKARCIYYLDNERAQLWSPANLAATGCDGTVSPGCLPVAAFTSPKANVCAGDSVHFQDMSSGPATAWNWTFQGGSPATSSLQNPAVAWSTPGTYDVTLRATNGIGSDTATVTSYVTIVAPQGTTSPLIEDFEASPSLPAGWFTTDEDVQGSWTVSTVTGASGSQSLVAHNYMQATPLTRDEVISAPFGLAGETAPVMYFSHAYKRRSSFTIDSLEVLFSLDCGATWQSAWARAGQGLVTVPGYGTLAPFVPTSTQWRRDTVDLIGAANASNVRVMFRSVGGASQDIYIDDINLPVLAAVKDPSTAALAATAWPNPAGAQAPQVRLTLAQASAVRGQLVDGAGRVVYSWGPQHLGAGAQDWELPAADWGKLSTGLYCLQLQSKGGAATIRLVKSAQ